MVSSQMENRMKDSIQHDNYIAPDNNKGNLSKLADEFPSGSDVTISTFEMDVSNVQDWDRIQRDVLALHPGGVDLLMLNAGGSFKPAAGKTNWRDPEYFQKTFAVNTFGYINGIAAFIDSITSNKTDKRVIILTGSKQGITNPPGNPAYNASKSAVKTIAEHLSFDLHVSNPNVSVHFLIPGWTYTGLMTAHFPTKPDGAWAPEEVVEFMSQKMAAGQFYILCPDNDVTEDLDRRRITWGYGDIIYGRPALSRWREDWKSKAADGIDAIKLPPQ
ncbi:short chain dehydrogenase/reductase [Talaromyces stipitatus ATCC 10500]|uniref:Short chain dehydrogenase/reductase n=1 Tax=Talaromyces stipitatus (strain ATCC 10500 / CBS 375.48 / QM 6759 / NRRL 1006) TaxID=441959 RepID=B8MAH5_TALSN|nr:short chain dehydrogenase/reductase [Talaromyces stipitatus ATCC 10500]EED17399.1 short chain dehydrogenase/reductase [Talaromyces stipitatus ATCC 10500]